LVGRGNGHGAHLWTGAGVVSFPGAASRLSRGEGLGVFSSDTAKLRAETVMQTVQTDESTAHRPSSPVSTTHDSRLTTHDSDGPLPAKRTVSTQQSAVTSPTRPHCPRRHGPETAILSFYRRRRRDNRMAEEMSIVRFPAATLEVSFLALDSRRAVGGGTEKLLHQSPLCR
jgi:hypothetical protein